MNDPVGIVTEIYSAIQGEGLYVGERQILVRFFHCSLGCRYCDTPDHLFQEGKARVEQTPGKRDFMVVESHVSPERLMEYCQQLNHPAGLHQSITLTGGEPLEQADFLKTFIPLVKVQTSLPIFLETNGILFKELQKLRGLLDIISMDIKLASTTGLRQFWQEHKKFLIEATTNSKVYVKMVVNNSSLTQEIEAASGLVAEIDPKIPVILQPETTENPREAITPERLLLFQEIIKRKLARVLVIPQTHKIINQL